MSCKHMLIELADKVVVVNLDHTTILDLLSLVEGKKIINVRYY